MHENIIQNHALADIKNADLSPRLILNLPILHDYRIESS